MNLLQIEAVDDDTGGLEEWEVLGVRCAKKDERILDLDEQTVSTAGNDHTFWSVVLRKLGDQE